MLFLLLVTVNVHETIMKAQKVIERNYTTPEIAAILGVRMRKVISMLERGYFKPSIQEANGHASRRLFSFDDVARAYIILELSKFGLSVEYTREMSIYLQGLLREPYLMIDKHGTICPTNPDIKEANKLKLDYLNHPTYSSDPSPILYVDIKGFYGALLKKIMRRL